MQDIATEIVPLTPESVAVVVKSVGVRQESVSETERRSSVRWQFDGVVEFRDSMDGKEFANGPEFGTLGNISACGLCMKCDRDLAMGNILDLGVHTGVSTLIGRGIVVGSHDAGDFWLVRVKFNV